MSTFLGTFIVIGIAFTGLASGLIITNKPIEGSCGGVMTSKDGVCHMCAKTEMNSCSKTDS